MAVGVFDYHSVPPAEVSLAADLAWAAYEGNPLPLGWQPLDAIDLGFAESPGDGTFDGYYFETGTSAPGGSAIALRNEDRLAIAFRGTDDALDLFRYPSLLNGNSYIDAFLPFLAAVAEYAQTSGISDILVTGHSLGAAAANILRDVSTVRPCFIRIGRCA
jgi:hypothetical protein